MIIDNVNINRDINDISMKRGDTLAFAFQVAGVDDDEVTLDDARFQVKADKDDDEYIIQATLSDTSSGDGIYSEGDGIYSVRIRPETTADLEPTTYFYTLKIVAGQDEYTIQDGRLIIKKGEQ